MYGLGMSIVIPIYLTSWYAILIEKFIGYTLEMFYKDFLPKIRIENPIAKELSKFNERCMIHLLGDMLSYNYLFAYTLFDHCIQK